MYERNKTAKDFNEEDYQMLRSIRKRLELDIEKEVSLSFHFSLYKTLMYGIPWAD